MIYEKFNLELFYSHGTVILKIKKSSMDFFRITCFKESKNLEVERNFKVTINFYKKLCLPVITWNKKYLLK